MLLRDGRGRQDCVPIHGCGSIALGDSFCFIESGTSRRPNSTARTGKVKENMSKANARRAHPLLWVPTLYFAEGTPMVAVSGVAAIMYKNLGVSNEKIALYTGMLYLPWTIKPLWAPILEAFKTKRFFVLSMEFAMMVTFFGLAFVLKLPSYLALTLGLFWMTGFASATHDIAADGVYIASMSSVEQANYAGVQGTFWNLGRLLTVGFLVSLTGYLHDGRGLNWFESWRVIMIIIGSVMGAMALWHIKILPPGDVAKI